MGGLTDGGRVVVRRIFTPVARLLLKAHVSPDAVTVVGTVGVSAGALYFYPRGEFFWGTVVIAIFVFSDSLDGTMARLSGRSSQWGAFWDSTLDRISDAAIFVGVAMWFAGNGDDNLLVAVCLAGLVGGLMVSYARARAEGLGADGSAGFAERTERLVLVLLMIGLSGLLDLPILLDIGLWAVAILSWLTVGQRIWSVRNQLHRSDASS